MTSSPSWITASPSRPREGSSNGALPAFPGRAQEGGFTPGEFSNAESGEHHSGNDRWPRRDCPTAGQTPPAASPTRWAWFPHAPRAAPPCELECWLNLQRHGVGSAALSSDARNWAVLLPHRWMLPRICIVASGASRSGSAARPDAGAAFRVARMICWSCYSAPPDEEWMISPPLFAMSCATGAYGSAEERAMGGSFHLQFVEIDQLVFPLATAKKVPSRRFGLEIEQDASH